MPESPVKIVATSLIILPIVLLVLLGLAIWWFIAVSTKGKHAARAEAARAEADRVRRAAADQFEPTLAGQQEYAAQAAEREDWARAQALEAQRQAERAQQDAEEAAARAAAAAEEAAAGRAALAETETTYAAQLHHADVLDPDTDVTETDPVPVPDAVPDAAPDAGPDAGPDAVGAAAPLPAGEPEDWLEPTTEDTWTDAGLDDPGTDDADPMDPDTGDLEPMDPGTGDLEPMDPGAGDPDPRGPVTQTADGDWQHDEAMFGETSADAVAAMPSQAPETAAWGRRISDLDEVTDGGYGVGSAAPISDGAQPLGHPVQGYHDTRTYRVEGAPGYDSREPDVWFFDAASAERAGFSRAEGS